MVNEYQLYTLIKISKTQSNKDVADLAAAAARLLWDEVEKEMSDKREDKVEVVVTRESTPWDSNNPEKDIPWT